MLIIQGSVGEEGKIGSTGIAGADVSICYISKHIFELIKNEEILSIFRDPLEPQAAQVDKEDLVEK